MEPYAIFKFVHIVAIIIWVGGVIAVSVLNARIARREERAALAAIVRQSRFFGAALVGPSALIALITGFALTGISGIGFPLWVLWGLAAIVLSMALGMTFQRRAGAELDALIPAAEPDDPRLRALQRRLAILSTINVLLLLSAVWAMVLKPIL